MFREEERNLDPAQFRFEIGERRGGFGPHFGTARNGDAIPHFKVFQSFPDEREIGRQNENGMLFSAAQFQPGVAQFHAKRVGFRADVNVRNARRAVLCRQRNRVVSVETGHEVIINQTADLLHTVACDYECIFGHTFNGSCELVEAAHKGDRARGGSAAVEGFARPANRREVRSRTAPIFKKHSLCLGEG